MTLGASLSEPLSALATASHSGASDAITGSDVTSRKITGYIPRLLVRESGSVFNILQFLCFF